MPMRIISGKYKNLALKSPAGMETRPTSSRMRESVFNILQSIVDGARFLDLFAGSGAMGLEALSRGASHATFVDASRDAARAIQENITKLNVRDQTTLLSGDCLKMLPRLLQLGSGYDIIYIDPPYDSPLTSQLLEAIDQSELINPGGILFLEESKDFKPPTLSKLTFVKSRKMGRSTLYRFEILN